MTATPRITSGGLLVVPTTSRKLVALNQSTGAIVWTDNLSGGSLASPTVAGSDL